MKKQFRIILSTFLTLVLLGCASGSGWNLGSGGFRLRPYKDVVLKNGLKVTLIEDKTLPYISMGMLIKVGSAQDPQGQSGLSDMVADLLDKGTRQHSALELSDMLAQYGGEFSASTGNDATYLGGSALSFHEEKLVKHFAEIVTEASFTNVEIERLRKRRLAQLKQQADDPETVTELAFDAFLYPNHPYGRSVSGSMQDVKKIGKKQITVHYLQYYRPSNAHLAVVGKYSPEIIERLESAFSKWSDRPVKAQPLLGFPVNNQKSFLIVDRADLQQAQIRFGHEGIRRNNPDFIPLRVATALLGGGFSSRLMSEIRVKRGLTYSINSYFDARLDQGPFVISTFTRHDKIGETVREVLRVVEDFKTQGPNEQELKEAKELLKGQFPRTLETPESLASNLLYLRFYGVPDRYLSTYLSEVDRVSLKDVKRVLAQYFKPEHFKVLVHAPRAKALPQLEGLGAVKVEPANRFLQ